MLGIGCALAVIGFGIGSCAGWPLTPPPEYTVRLDGDVEEWASTGVATSDEHYLYLRFTLEGEQFSLTSAPRTVSIFIDSDANATTGTRHADPALQGLGTDIEVQFSPRGERGPTRGAAVWFTEPDGTRTKHKASVFGLVVAPTYASSWYEVRISRTPSGVMLPPNGMGAMGKVRGVVAVLNTAGEVDAWADAFEIEIDTVRDGGDRKVAAFPPEKASETLRVLTWNVERTSPMKNPEPFRRVLRALDPDVVLFQEWEEGDGASVIDWLREGGFEAWHVHKAAGTLSDGGGVLIASRYPVTAAGDVLRLEGGAASGTPHVRFVAGVVGAPGGNVLVGSAHLKCCGNQGSPEDRKRMAETRAINGMLRDVLAALPASERPTRRVIGGDLNLVGGRPPLDLLRAGLDGDDSDLAVVTAPVLGDEAFYTWRNDKTPFPPGRLDYLLYSDAGCEATASFAFDTTVLSSVVLEFLGVEAGDSLASDHLPVVVDLR